MIFLRKPYSSLGVLTTRDNAYRIAAFVWEIPASHLMTALEQYDASIELHRAGKVAESIEMLRKMTADFPDFSLAYNALAAFSKKANDLNAAIDNMKTYCTLEPDDPFGFSVLSAYSIAAGRRAEAEEALARASEIRFKAQFGASVTGNGVTGNGQ